jgi:anthranilate phosphoribosyltransferase
MTATLEKLLRRTDLTVAEADALLEALTDRAVPPAQAGALLAALRAKGETPDEIRGFASAMRRLAQRPPIDRGLPAIDIVGTGGDGSGSLNISTGAALLAAACGLPVVKHGNRSISSRSGSADVLEALGYTLPADGDAAARSLKRTGFTFLFAPTFHPAMAALAPVRRSLGVRTMFNMLGPLTNPAEPPFGVFGAFSEEAAAKMADVLAELPIERAFVVHGAHGWDEATPCGPFLLFDVRPGRVERSTRDPRDDGFAACSIDALVGGDTTYNAKRLREALEGQPGAHRDALVLGAALALEVTGRAETAAAARAVAEQAIDSGAARGTIDALKHEAPRV